MNLKLLIPVGLIALAIGLITNLPAPVAAGWVESQVPGLRSTGVSGSAFEGRAQYLGMNEVTLENVSWQLSPLALLTGHAKATLKLSTDTGSLSGDFSHSLLGHTQIKNLNGDASIGWIAGLAGYRFVPMDGLLSLQDVEADLENQLLVSAQGRVLLNSANWLLFKPPVTFGNFTAEINSDGENNTLQVLDSDGPLDVQGGAQLVNNKNYSANLQVRARAGADQRLKDLLKQLGNPDAQGWYRINERGQL